MKEPPSQGCYASWTLLSYHASLSCTSSSESSWSTSTVGLMDHLLVHISLVRRRESCLDCFEHHPPPPRHCISLTNVYLQLSRSQQPGKCSDGGSAQGHTSEGQSIQHRTQHLLHRFRRLWATHGGLHQDLFRQGCSPHDDVGFRRRFGGYSFCQIFWSLDCLPHGGRSIRVWVFGFVSHTSVSSFFFSFEA